MSKPTLSAQQLRDLFERYVFTKDVVQRVFDSVADGPRNPLEKTENVLRRAMENATDPLDEARKEQP